MVHITALGAFRPHADSASSGRTRTTTLTASSCPLGERAADDRSNSSISNMKARRYAYGRRALGVPRGFQVWVSSISTP